MNRMKSIHDLSTPCWQGRWHSGSSYDGASRDDYRDYARTIPVLATTLTRLQQHGPHGPVWWRFGHSAPDTLGHPAFETLEHALDNPDDSRAYVREEQRRLERHALVERERQEEEEAERRQKVAAWPCPTCGRKVWPDGDWETSPTGSDCGVCTSIKRREQEEAAATLLRRQGSGRKPGGTVSSAFCAKKSSQLAIEPPVQWETRRRPVGLTVM